VQASAAVHVLPLSDPSSNSSSVTSAGLFLSRDRQMGGVVVRAVLKHLQVSLPESVVTNRRWLTALSKPEGV